MYRLGFYIYALEGLFGSKKASVKQKAKAKRANKQQENFQEINDESSDNDSESCDSTDIDDNIGNSTHNIFNGEECDQFDQDAIAFGKLLQRQSDRDRGRCFFPTGITGDKKKNGHEMQGVVLVILTVFLSVQFGKFQHLFGGEHIGALRITKWIILLEYIMMVEEFLKSKNNKKKDVLIFQKWMKYIFLQRFKRVVNRTTKMCFKLLKFHLGTHFAADIIKWGHSQVYDSSTGESNHKGLKGRSKKTQRRTELLEEQTGVHYVEHLAISKTLYSMKIAGQKLRTDLNSKEKEDEGAYSGASFL